MSILEYLKKPLEDTFESWEWRFVFKHKAFTRLWFNKQCVGNIASPLIEIFLSFDSSVRTDTQVTSLPVPHVVGRTIKGQGAFENLFFPMYESISPQISSVETVLEFGRETYRIYSLLTPVWKILSSKMTKLNEYSFFFIRKSRKCWKKRLWVRMCN